jgi:CDP-glycerol glycerophosphotransferase
MASESPVGGRLPLVSFVPAGDGRLDVPEAGGRAEVADSIAAARGTYVWAIAPGDRLVPGALALVLARLEERDPDVLLVGHDKAGGKLLERVAAEPGPLEAHPRVADTARRPWDKVVRRTLLGPGAEPGLVATWRALLAAERIDALPALAYVREARGEMPPAADVVAAHEAVLATPDVPPARRKLIAPAAVRHQLALLERAAPAEHDALFHRVSAFVNAHGSGGERGRVAKVRASLLARDRPRAYRAVGRADRTQRAARRRARRMRTRAAKRLRTERRRRAYKAALKRPMDEHLAVYAAYWYAGYSCNPRAIYEKARELAPEIRGVWVVKPEHAAKVPAGVEVVAPGTSEYLDVMARAKYFVNNVNFPNEYVKRPGSVHVMTHHGTPLKYMGMDLRSNPVTAAKMDFDALLRRCARWDFSVSSNPLSSEVWAKVYPVEYENLEVGYPRNDVLATATDEAVAVARASLGLEPGKRAVLYAPTHRDWETGHVPVLDLGAAAEALGPDGVLLARAHYFYDADPVARSLDRAGRLLDVATHPSIETLCLAADVLVTDYSSLMFDYAVLDRPIVIHAPDWERYKDTRGVYFDLMAEPPGVVCRTQDALLEVLRSGVVTTPEADAQRAAFRARFCALEDGRAAERVVRRVLLGDPEAAAPPAASLA